MAWNTWINPNLEVGCARQLPNLGRYTGHGLQVSLGLGSHLPHVDSIVAEREQAVFFIFADRASYINI